MPQNSSSELHDLLVDQMESMLHAENQLVKALPKMAKSSHSSQLRQAFSDHLGQTRGHVERLHQAFELLGAKARARTSKGMQGLVEEGEEAIEIGKDMDPEAADLGLIIAAQKIEHYEVAVYGCLRTLAERIGEARVGKLFADNLADERRADELLTQVAQPLIAKAA